MKQINRSRFLGGTVKGALGLLTISVYPFGLVVCEDNVVDTSAMANLGPLDELKSGHSLRRLIMK